MTQSDEELLEAIAVLYAAVDPAPTDLAEGVLARLAVDDLETEYELLTLVEQVDHASGTRGPDVATAGDDTTVALEFAGTSYRVLVRISSVDGRRRLDGWITPGSPLRVALGPASDPRPDGPQRRVVAGADGRFEFPDPGTGEVRLWLAPPVGGATGTAFVTPPFVL